MLWDRRANRLQQAQLSFESRAFEPAARYALGRIDDQQGRCAEAAAQLEQVVAREPGNFRADDQLAQTLRRLDQTVEAKVHLDTFRKLKSEPRPAPNRRPIRIIQPMLVLAALLFAMTVQAQDAAVGSRVCADCHAEIYRTYMETGMARSSGRAGSASVVEKLPAGPISDKSSGASYRIIRGTDS